MAVLAVAAAVEVRGRGGRDTRLDAATNIGWFLVRYENGGVEEYLRFPGDAFNNNARGSWRVNLDSRPVAVSRAAGAAAVTSADAATEAAAWRWRR